MIIAYNLITKQLTQVEHSFMLKPSSEWIANPIISDMQTLLSVPTDQWFYDIDTTELRILNDVELNTLPDRVAKAQANKIAELSQACANSVTSGFQSSTLGVPFWYDATPVDQLNMISSISAAAPTQYFPDGVSLFYPCRELPTGQKQFQSHTYNQLRKIADDASQVRLNFLQEFAFKKLLTQQALTVADVNAITWN